MTDLVPPRLGTPAQVKGWCPGTVRPMPAQDGWVVRIRPPGGRLTMAQAQGVAELVSRFAQPQLELTNRANLQLRGVQPAQHPLLLDGLRALQLVDDDAGGEARRNVQVQPLWLAGDVTPELAQRLSELLTRAHALAALPAKFGFAVDTGEQPCLREAYADIRLERHADGVLVYADGASHGVVASVQAAPQLAADLAHWFLSAGGAPCGRGRMHALLRQCRLPAQWQQTPVAAASGVAPGPGVYPAGRLVGLAFGLVQARTLAALGACGPLRLTPWRSLLVEGAAELPHGPELIVAPADARLRVAACTGSPGCDQAAGPTRCLALELAPSVPLGHLLHVSGCTKGCAHPKAAATVVATPQGFDFVRLGTAASVPSHRGVGRADLAQLLGDL